MTKLKLFSWLVIFFLCYDFSISDTDDICSSDEIHDNCCGKNGYILVATIDGNLTSLDFDSGQKCWSIVLDSKEFLSSTLSTLEVWENGTQVWLVPSLDGSMFKYDKVKLVPLPFNVESLLKRKIIIDPTSSVTGGKFKIVYGLHRQTGKMFYKCTMEGCEHFEPVSEKDALILEQWVQSVNAVDTVTTELRWNFRVAEIKVSAINDSSNGKNSSQDPHDTKFDNTALIPVNKNDLNPKNSIKISLVNGYAARVNHSTADFMWLYKTLTPLMDVWFIKDKEVFLLDAFSEGLDLYNIETDDGKYIASLFLGSYLEQLYVKQSKLLKNKVVNNFAVSTRIPYQAFCLPLTSQAKQDLHLPSNDSNALVITDVNANDHGFYYYADFFVYDNDTHCVVNFTFPKRPDELDDFTYWLIKVSIAMGSLMSAIIFSLAYLVWREFQEKNFSNESNSTTEVPPGTVAAFDIKKDKAPEFISRFHKDFQLIAILGRGGFGVVMEVKNKIDDCEYAVKRIRIKTEDSKRSDYFNYVMREVKALAKLDHPGIVRYFNSWIENPPKGWQESKDKELNIADVTVEELPISELRSGFKSERLSDLHPNFEASIKNKQKEPIKTSKKPSSKTSKRQKVSSSRKSKKQTASNLKITEKLAMNPLNPFGNNWLDSILPDLDSNKKDIANDSDSGSWYNEDSNVCIEAGFSTLKEVSKETISKVNVPVKADFSIIKEVSKKSETKAPIEADSSTVKKLSKRTATEVKAPIEQDSSIVKELSKRTVTEVKNPIEADSSTIKEESKRSKSKINNDDKLLENWTNEKIFSPKIHVTNKNIEDSRIHNGIKLDPLCINKDVDIKTLCSLPDLFHDDEKTMFLHITKINNFLSWKMNPMILNKLQRYIFYDKSRPSPNHSEWSEWICIFKDVPFNQVEYNLCLFRNWMASVLCIIKHCNSYYSNLIGVNLCYIMWQINLIVEDDICKNLISDFERSGSIHRIGAFFVLMKVNTGLAYPLKFIYLIKLRHYMFCRSVILAPNMCNQPGWKSVFYQADNRLFKKNLKIFQTWIMSVMFKIQYDGGLSFLNSLSTNLSIILHDVMYHLENEIFQPTPVEEFFNVFGNLLDEEKDKHKFSGCEDIQYLVMFHKVSSFHLVKLQKSKEEKIPGFLYIQMQLCKRESLRTWLDNNFGSRDYFVVIKMFCQIVEAMNYLHTKGLMHRDLKPSNIFFSLEGSIKIGDFGLATQFMRQEAEVNPSSSNSNWDHTRDIGTELYMSPEQRSKKEYNYKTDIFSMGIIFFELLMPFQTHSERCQAISNARRHKFDQIFVARFPNECVLVKRLLDHDPGRRPTASEILKHPVCKDYL